MTDVAIRIEGLGKRYFIGGEQESYDRFGERLFDVIKSPFRRAGRILTGHSSGAAELNEIIWALSDVSLDINSGEAVGIIGRNGAGKSTLLKILSRITEPTEGSVDIYGRVGSLLEVGTGFHPELTGRENIYLNGAILGMRKEEIEKKFDQIVSFAEIDKFLDTPVKHYSSGMYVRLAFSIAAHLEPEILLVDEVLAVGDVNFQRKCLGKMDDVTQQGRTVLFVSHNMALLQAFCERGIYLENGRIAANGPMVEVINMYLESFSNLAIYDLSKRTDRNGIGKVKLQALDIVDAEGNNKRTFKSGESIRLIFHLDGEIKKDLFCKFMLRDEIGQPVVSFNSRTYGSKDIYSSEIGAKFICDINELLLIPGRYQLDLEIRNSGGEVQDSIDAVSFLDVVDGQVDGRSVGTPRQKKTNVYFPHQWIKPE